MKFKPEHLGALTYTIEFLNGHIWDLKTMDEDYSELEEVTNLLQEIYDNLEVEE